MAHEGWKRFHEHRVKGRAESLELLSQVLLSPAAVFLQIHSQLLGICRAGHRTLRDPSRRQDGIPTARQLSSVSRGRIRSPQVRRKGITGIAAFASQSTPVYSRIDSMNLNRLDMQRQAALYLLPLLFLINCSALRTRIDSPSTPIAQVRVSQTGIASWYGPGFHGKATASATIYNQNEMTAAHPTLPLGSRVMVTNLKNGKSTEVIINDRGPFAKGRIIDLSFAAGRTLGLIEPGTAPVRLEVIDSGPHKIRSIPDSLNYTLQLGAFSQLENARQLHERLSASYAGVSIVPVRAKDAMYYRVLLGTFIDRNAAEERARQLSQAGFAVIIMEK
jgi:rare lipoprotein A